jgi:hypothetical protein
MLEFQIALTEWYMNLPRSTTRFPAQKKRDCSEDSSSEQKPGPKHRGEEYRDDVDHLDQRI